MSDHHSSSDHQIMKSGGPTGHRQKKFRYSIPVIYSGPNPDGLGVRLSSSIRPQSQSSGTIELGCPSVCASVIVFLYGLELLRHAKFYKENMYDV